jgi:hypothetical protein
MSQDIYEILHVRRMEYFQGTIDVFALSLRLPFYFSTKVITPLFFVDTEYTLGANVLVPLFVLSLNYQNP